MSRRRFSLASLVLVAVLFTPAVGSAALIGSLREVSPTPTTFVLGTDFLPLFFSPLTPIGGVTAPLVAIDLVLPPTPTPTSTSGCEAADFGGGLAVGKIALLMDGGCDYDVKSANAAAAGAIAVIVFGEGQPGHTDVITASLSSPAAGLIPIVYASFAVGGNEFGLGLGRGPITVTLEVTDSTPPPPAIPEPTTLALVMSGCLGLARRFRRRQA